MPFSSKKKQREYQREYQRMRRRKTNKDDYTVESGSKISPEVKIAILVTAVFALAILVVLSFFDLAGPLGIYTKAVLKLAFGWGAAAFPLLLAAIGFLLLKGFKYALNRWQILGAVILFLAFLGILHHVPEFENAIAAVNRGEGGGYIGLALSSPFASIAGYWGAWVFLAVLMVVGALLSLSGILFWREEEEEAEEQEKEINKDEFKGENTLPGRLMEKWRVWRYRKEYNNSEEEPAPSIDEEAGVEGEDEEHVEGEEPFSSESEDVSPEPIITKKIKRKISIPLDLLESSTEKPSADDVESTKEKIAKTFKTFGIDVEMDEVNVGPTVTQYTLRPPSGVKLSRLTGLANELSLSLAVHPLRMEAPIPGRSLIGIEVPNKFMASVKLKDLLMSTAFKNRSSNLSICLGKDVSGKAWIADLTKMPHLLIAGSTGSGKSVAINSIITSLMYQNSPDDLKLVLVDPKKVELTVYNNIPYLLTPVITDAKKTVNALKWVVSEMERRYVLLSNRGKRNIEAYNASNKKDTIPTIVFIIDELADLMSVAANDVEAATVRLAQMARAVGIHLVLATQRPSVNVITGLIKANVPSRIAFVVPSQIDSRTILDCAGAEKLLGRGDMLFISPEFNKPRRLQGAFLKDEETERVVNFLKEQGEAEYHEEVTESQNNRGSDASGNGSGGSAGEDELYDEAKEEVVRAGKASASLLQRRLRIGYARAARLLDILETEGIVGPADGAKPRDILVGTTSHEADGFEDAELYNEDHGSAEEEADENNR